MQISILRCKRKEIDIYVRNLKANLLHTLDITIDALISIFYIVSHIVCFLWTVSLNLP